MEGLNSREGRVEVYYSEAWGVVCGVGWDMIDAAVVCRSLGYGGVSSFRGNISYKSDNGTLWMREVQCNGNETFLTQCAHTGWGRDACVESQAAGVACFEQGSTYFRCYAPVSSLLDIRAFFHIVGTIRLDYQPLLRRMRLGFQGDFIWV